MLRVLCSSDVRVRDALVNTLSLEKQEESPIATIYRREMWIFVLLHETFREDHMHWIAATFIPERVYFPFFAESIDVVHEIGDVIAPNVFLTHNPEVEKALITRENRDTFDVSPRFLSLYEEQKDYYVEDFGLSIGGIAVHSTPTSLSDDLMGKMMLAYEGDVYLSESLDTVVSAVESDIIPAMILTGIIRGKKNSRYPSDIPETLTAKNIITTIRLMEEDEV